MKTKFLVTILFMFACAEIASAQATDISNLSDVIYIQKTNGKPGEQAKLSVRLKNESIVVRGYQFDLYLPEGIGFVKDEDGYYEANLSTSRTTEKKMNFFDCDLQSDGALRILCSSTNGAVLDGTDGEICTIQVEVDPDAENKDYLLQVRNAVVTDPDATRYPLNDVTSIFTVSDCDCGLKGDMNGDGRITVSDIMIIVNTILNN